MPQEWIVPTILMTLALFLLAVWVPVIREARKRRR